MRNSRGGTHVCMQCDMPTYSEDPWITEKMRLDTPFDNVTRPPAQEDPATEKQQGRKTAGAATIYIYIYIYIYGGVSFLWVGWLGPLTTPRSKGG